MHTPLQASKVAKYYLIARRASTAFCLALLLFSTLAAEVLAAEYASGNYVVAPTYTESHTWDGNGNMTITITITNNDAVTYETIDFLMTVTDGQDIVTTGTSWNGDPISADNNYCFVVLGQYQCFASQVPPGGVVTFTIVVRRDWKNSVEVNFSLRTGDGSSTTEFANFTIDENRPIQPATDLKLKDTPTSFTIPGASQDISDYANQNSEVAARAPFTFNYTLENAGPEDAGYKVTAEFQATADISGAVVGTVNGSTTNCTVTPTSSSLTTIVCTGNAPANSSVLLTATFPAQSLMSFSYSSSVIHTDFRPDSDTSNNSGSSSWEVKKFVKMGMTPTITPADDGNSATLSLAFENQGVAPLTDAQFAAILGTGIGFDQTNATGVVVGAEGQALSIDWIGELAPSESSSFDILLSVVFPQPPATITSTINRVNKAGVVYFDGLTTPVDVGLDPPPPAADLDIGLAKVLNETSVWGLRDQTIQGFMNETASAPAHSPYLFNLELVNHESEATAVEVVLEFEGSSLTAGIAGSLNIDSEQCTTSWLTASVKVTCMGTVQADATIPISVSFPRQIPQIIQWSARADLTEGRTDSDESDNEKLGSWEVKEFVKMGMTPTISVADDGSSATLAIEVENQGVVPLTDFQIAATLGAGLGFSQTSAEGIVVGAAGQVLTIDWVGELAVGGATSFDILLSVVFSQPPTTITSSINRVNEPLVVYFDEINTPVQVELDPPVIPSPVNLVLKTVAQPLQIQNVTDQDILAFMNQNLTVPVSVAYTYTAELQNLSSTNVPFKLTVLPQSPQEILDFLWSATLSDGVGSCVRLVFGSPEITCNGTIPANATVSLLINGTSVSAGGVMLNASVIPTTGFTESDNSDNELAPLVLAKQFVKMGITSTVAVADDGVTVTLSTEIENQSPSTASDTQLAVTLDEKFSYESTNTPGVVVGVSGQGLSVVRAEDLEPGEKTTIEMILKVVPPASQDTPQEGTITIRRVEKPGAAVLDDNGTPKTISIPLWGPKVTVLGDYFEDVNGNGQQDLGEPTIGGDSPAPTYLSDWAPYVDINLNKQKDEEDPVAFPNTVGGFTIPSVPVGDRTMMVDPGKHIPSDVDLRLDFSKGITFRASAQNGSEPESSLHIPLFKPATLSGTVYLDNNNDQNYDPLTDTALPNAQVGCSGPSCPEGTKATTDQDGGYTFSMMPPGQYSFTLEPSDGFEVPLESGGASREIGLMSGASEIINFGLRPIPSGQIHGRKIVDWDGDGEQDQDEPGLNGVTINLVAGGNVVASQITHAMDVNEDGHIDPFTEFGHFWFENLQDGDYTITEVAVEGMTVTSTGGMSQAVTLASGNTINSIIFTNQPTDGIMDWGDLPDQRGDLIAMCPGVGVNTCYPTNRTSFGPSHLLIPQAFVLGEIIDYEPGGQSDTNALGDDEHDTLPRFDYRTPPVPPDADDEEGLIDVSLKDDGSLEFVVRVTDPLGTRSMFLDIWVDINNDGYLADRRDNSSLENEDVVIAASVTTGLNTITTAPLSSTTTLGANLGFIRMRLSSTGELWPFGPWIDGEVEDYFNVAVDTSIELEELDVLPESIHLSQNYPNPFNPVTSIEFGSDVSGNVTLEVLDVLGKQVALLVDGWKNAGVYKVSFDASNLPSGIYLYRLQVGGESITKHLTLLK